MNTRDLTKFGQRERVIAAQLLLAIGTDIDKTKFLSDDVSVEFNPNSGYVFLVDGNNNTAMMNDGKLEDYITCYNCGAEALASNFREECTDECCQEVAVA